MRTKKLRLFPGAPVWIHGIGGARLTSFAFIINKYWIFQAIFIGLIIGFSTLSNRWLWTIAAELICLTYAAAEGYFAKKGTVLGISYDSENITFWRAVILEMGVFFLLWTLYMFGPNKGDYSKMDSLWLLFLLPTIVVSHKRPTRVIGRALILACMLMIGLYYLIIPIHNFETFAYVFVKVVWICLLAGMTASLVWYITDWYQTFRMVGDIEEGLINIRSVRAQINLRTVGAQNSLLQSTVNRLAQLYKYPHVNFFELSNGMLKIVAASDPQGEILVQENFSYAISNGIIGHVAQTGKSYLANDVSDDKFYNRHPVFPLTQAELVVPVNVGGRLYGVIDIQAQQKNTFFFQDREAIEALARHLGLILDNFKLYEDSQRVADITESIAQSLFSYHDLREALDSICTAAFDRFNADYVVIYERDLLTTEVVAAAHKGELIRRKENSLSSHKAGGFIHGLCSGRDDYFHQDAQNSTITIRDNDGNESRIQSTFANDEDIVSRVIIRLRTSHDTLGVMLVNFRTRRSFDHDDEKQYYVFANLAALAIQRARAIKEQMQSEREQLARDLHDRIRATADGALRIIATVAKREEINSKHREDLGNAIEALNDMQADLRFLNDALKDQPSNDFDQELRKVKRITEAAYGIEFVLNRTGTASIPSSITSQIRPILNEAIMNAVNHGSARTITLSIDATDGKLSVKFEDNGFGFDSNLIGAPRGLNNISTRAKKLGGVCEIRSVPHEGTFIELALPI